VLIIGINRYCNIPT